MEASQTKSININELISLCHILDDYGEFNDNLRNLVSARYSIYGEKMYQENKNVVDTINKYLNISDFIRLNYIERTGTLREDSNLDFFYQYILNNKKDIEKILAVLNRIKELGINESFFNENIDFTNTEYKVNTRFNDNLNIKYLDNMEAIPNYQSDVVKYKTNGSNYEIDITTDIIANRKMRYTPYKIIHVNSLVFDANRLPKGNIFNEILALDEILALKNKKFEECNVINNVIGLNLNIESAISNIISIDNIINRIDDIENKDELLKMIEQLHVNLDKLKAASSNYDTNIANAYPTITPDLLQKEKKLYLERIEWNKIDND